MFSRTSDSGNFCHCSFDLRMHFKAGNGHFENSWASPLSFVQFQSVNFLKVHILRSELLLCVCFKLLYINYLFSFNFSEIFVKFQWDFGEISVRFWWNFSEILGHLNHGKNYKISFFKYKHWSNIIIHQTVK